MKKFSNLFGNTKVMALSGLVGMSTVFGLSSCQDDYFEDQSNIPVNKAQDKNNENVNDSVFVYDNDFNYDNYGISSPDQYVSPVGYNVGSMVQSRAAADDFASQLLLFASSKLTEVTGNPAAYAVEFTLNMLLDNGDNPVMTQLETLNNNVDSLTKLTNKLTNFVIDSDFSDKYKKHRLAVSILQTMNCTHFNSYNKYLKQGNKEAAKAVLNEWAVQDAGDFKAPYAVLHFLESTIMPCYSNGKDITNIYDYWVFNTTPWEHEGYDKRDALRCGDIVVGFTGYMLARAYFEQEGLVDHTTTLKNLDNDFKEFLSFYKERSKVERHNDRIVCQIKDANIVFHKDIFIRDMFNHPWIQKEYETLSQFMYFSPRPEMVTSVLDRSLSSKETEAIFNYYNPKDMNGKYKNATVKTMEQIMKEAGFELDKLQSDKKHVMTLQDGGCHRVEESWFNRNYDFYYNKVAMVNQDNLFRNDFKVGCMWQASGSTWKIFHWDHYSAGDCQFFHTNIEKRYENMMPF